MGDHLRNNVPHRRVAAKNDCRGHKAPDVRGDIKANVQGPRNIHDQGVHQGDRGLEDPEHCVRNQRSAHKWNAEERRDDGGVFLAYQLLDLVGRFVEPIGHFLHLGRDPVDVVGDMPTRVGGGVARLAGPFPPQEGVRCPRPGLHRGGEHLQLPAQRSPASGEIAQLSRIRKLRMFEAVHAAPPRNPEMAAEPPIRSGQSPLEPYLGEACSVIGPSETSRPGSW